MEHQRRLATGTTALLIAVGLLILALYLYYFVPFGEVVSALHQADPFFYLSTFVALILSVVFSSLAWQRLLKTLSVKSIFTKAFQFVWVGYFVDLLIPAESVSSDISRIYLMSKETGEDAGKVTASVIAHRILATLISFTGLVISSLYFILAYRPSSFLLEFIAIINAASIALLSALFYFSTRPKATEKIANWIVSILSRLSAGRWRPDSLQASALRVLRAFHEGILTLGSRPKKLIFPVIFAVLAWFFDLLIVVLVFLSLGSLGRVPLSIVIIVYFIVIGLEDFPLGVPAGVGIMEIAMTSLYALFGVPLGLSAAATVLIRVITFWSKLLVGGLTAQWLGIKALSPPKKRD